jgi:hypothetical protein
MVDDKLDQIYTESSPTIILKNDDLKYLKMSKTTNHGIDVGQLV